MAAIRRSDDGVEPVVEFGAHLPLIPFSGGPPTLGALRAYAGAARRLGYRWLSANDHLVFRRPWLDGPTALAAVLDASGDLGLATTVCLPAVRGPVQAAKAFAALDLLSGGRFVAGLGPGSSERDYVLGGVPPVEALRALPLPIGPAELCAERMHAFARAGAQRAFIWPLGHDLRQLERFAERVVPRIPASPGAA